MELIKIKKGLDIPLDGAPEQAIYDAAPPAHVALLGSDYIGMKPTMAVAVGDQVKLGQLLFTDKKMAGVKYTAPGCGKVIAINRGVNRVFESIVIALTGDEEIAFESFHIKKLASLTAEKIKTQMIDSGLWISLRERPYGRTADPIHTPHSLFVTAMDTNPLAPAVEKVLAGDEEAFRAGLIILSKLTAGKLFVCKAPGTQIPTPEIENLVTVEFAGPHPAGNAGTHIHFLDPVHRRKRVWYISAQDAAAVGKLFTLGRTAVERIVSLAGPVVKQPRLLRTRLGVAIDEITAGEIAAGDTRLISGSVLNGRTAAGAHAYLGRYHQQITSLREGKERKFLGWLSPGRNLFSVKRMVLSRFFPPKRFDFSTSLGGERRAIFPVGSYEQVMPLDILPTFLLRALMAGDIEEAEKLGILELVEEDLALCTFVSPAKIEYGEVLRRNLALIEKEG